MDRRGRHDVVGRSGRARPGAHRLPRQALDRGGATARRGQTRRGAGGHGAGARKPPPQPARSDAARHLGRARTRPRPRDPRAAPLARDRGVTRSRDSLRGAQGGRQATRGTRLHRRPLERAPRELPRRPAGGRQGLQEGQGRARRPRGAHPDPEGRPEPQEGAAQHPRHPPHRRPRRRDRGRLRRRRPRLRQERRASPARGSGAQRLVERLEEEDHQLPLSHQRRFHHHGDRGDRDGAGQPVLPLVLPPQGGRRQDADDRGPHLQEPQRVPRARQQPGGVVRRAVHRRRGRDLRRQQFGRGLDPRHVPHPVPRGGTPVREPDRAVGAGLVERGLRVVLRGLRHPQQRRRQVEPGAAGAAVLAGRAHGARLDGIPVRRRRQGLDNGSGAHPAHAGRRRVRVGPVVVRADVGRRLLPLQLPARRRAPGVPPGAARLLHVVQEGSGRRPHRALRRDRAAWRGVVAGAHNRRTRRDLAPVDPAAARPADRRRRQRRRARDLRRQGRRPRRPGGGPRVLRGGPAGPTARHRPVGEGGERAREAATARPRGPHLQAV